MTQIIHVDRTSELLFQEEARAINKKGTTRIKGLCHW